MLDMTGVRESRAIRVFWLFEELGEDCRHVPAKPHAPEAEDCDSAGKPLAVDGAALADSSGIIKFTADRSGRNH